MTPPCDNLFVICDEVSALLDRYIAVHNEVFKFNVRRIIPIPFLFQRIDFEKQFRLLRFTEMDLEVITGQLPETCEDTPELLEVLREYMNRLMSVIVLLRELCGNLFQKANGAMQYTRQEYKRDVAAYEKAVEAYTETGALLLGILGLACGSRLRLRE